MYILLYTRESFGISNRTSRFCNDCSSFPTTMNNDNRSKQLNPNNDAYWKSRGYEERPNDWGQSSTSNGSSSSASKDAGLGLVGTAMTLGAMAVFGIQMYRNLRSNNDN